MSALFVVKLSIGIICFHFMTGCLYKGVRVAGIEPQAGQIESSLYRILGESEGMSSSFNLFWIIPVTPQARYDRAVHDAISGLKGDSLIDVRIWLERQIWIVGMVEILHVKGKVIQYEK
ncbi:MAG: hypothetical protein JXA07_00225 [Spirochaetes bacterium]|nr:hypothetical protein [Spirochaetota bacterium]